MKKLLLIFLLCSYSQTTKAEMEAFFTPSLDCENRIIELINTSQNSIKIAVYAINNDNIVKALEKAHQRKISIQILTDKLQAKGKTSLISFLQAKGIPLKTNRKYKIEHNKFAVFDEKILITGSFNWTNAASLKNSENCLFIGDKKMIKKYSLRFEHLWKLY